jgi:hypothetical protein
MSDENTAPTSHEDEYEQFVDELGMIAGQHPRSARQLFRSVELSVWVWIAMGVVAGVGADLLESEIKFPSLNVLVMYFVFQAVLGVLWAVGTIIGLIGLSLLPDRHHGRNALAP